MIKPHIHVIGIREKQLLPEAGVRPEQAGGTQVILLSVALVAKGQGIVNRFLSSA